MSDIKISKERRQQKRFKAQEGAFAALVDQESRLGQIKDISLQGLSFRYIDSSKKLDNASELKIILGNQGLYLDKVPFQKICDFEYEIKSFPPDRAKIDIGDYYSDYNLFKEATGWVPTVDLEEGLARTVEYFRMNLSHYI